MIAELMPTSTETPVSADAAQPCTLSRRLVSHAMRPFGLQGGRKKRAAFSGALAVEETSFPRRTPDRGAAPAHLRVTQGCHRLPDSSERGFGAGLGLRVCALVERCARFLQGACRGSEARTKRRMLGRGEPPVLGRESLFRGGKCARSGIDGLFGLAATLGHVLGPAPGGLACAFLRVERQAERLPKVTLFDGRPCPLERVGGGLELLRRVLIRPGGARRFDGALRLIELLVGRFSAGGGKKQRSKKHRAERSAQGA